MTAPDISQFELVDPAPAGQLIPLTALADDVARLRQVLDLQDGPVIVAGHSYGGQVMTALGADAPNVAGPAARS